jgi:hypothetical protein
MNVEPLSWIIIASLFLQMATAVPCPSICSCYGENVNCSHASVTSVPVDVMSNTTQFDASFNLIPILKNEDFVHTKHLKIIFLNNNNILRLEPYVFHQTEELLHLHLNDNKIIEINVIVFQFSKKLRYLHVQNNRIRYIHPQLFECNPDLVILDISGNQIQRLESNTFQCNPILSWVIVSGNPLTLPLEWKALFNGSLNVLDIEFCDDPNSSLNAFQMVPSLHLLRENYSSFVTLHDFISFENVLGLDVNEAEFLKLKLFQYLQSSVYASIYKMTIGEDLNVISLTGDAILCYCKYHNFWFWCNEQKPTMCPNFMTISEKNKFLECDAISAPRHIAESVTSDSDGSDQRFWPFRRPVNWKNVRETLLYASIPGCIVVLVIATYIVKRIRKRRIRKQLRNSCVYSAVNVATNQELPTGAKHNIC